jgi:hypothetical protein
VKFKPLHTRSSALRWIVNACAPRTLSITGAERSRVLAATLSIAARQRVFTAEFAESAEKSQYSHCHCERSAAK